MKKCRRYDKVEKCTLVLILGGQLYYFLAKLVKGNVRKLKKLRGYVISTIRRSIISWIDDMWTKKL